MYRGGIRGVVELEVLRRIEMELGELPIQCFIDLIVGTRYDPAYMLCFFFFSTNHAISTGGLVALGLASMNWTVDQCIKQFEGFCDQAFTRRTGSALPLVGHLVDHHHHSKYQTKTLESALKDAFTDEIQLFGGEQRPRSTTWQVKVAVTATALTGSKTYVLANYNGRRENKMSSEHSLEQFYEKMYVHPLTIHETITISNGRNFTLRN